MRAKPIGSATRLALLAWMLMPAPQSRAEIVDRIVMVVGGRPIAWSAAFEEASYQAFRRGEAPPAWKAAEPAAENMDTVLSILVDQALLQQALSRSPFALSGSEGIESRLREIERGFPSAEAYRDALARCRLSEEQLRQRLARENLLLAFVDATLRPQVRVAAEDVTHYYQEVFVTELARSQTAAAPPSMEEVRAQIEEILTQRQIDRLLEQWLAQLRRTTAIERRQN